jgi:flagellar FliL protein
VLDAFQIYLRELRPEDLEGSAGILRVKEELLRRINLAIQPPLATDILFKEVIIQ